jgi:predicted DNA-binding transcriptional regulator YafY
VARRSRPADRAPRSAQLEAGSELPPLLFDDDQAIALAVALQLATAAGAGIEETALRALGTVRQGCRTGCGAGSTRSRSPPRRRSAAPIHTT